MDVNRFFKKLIALLRRLFDKMIKRGSGQLDLNEFDLSGLVQFHSEARIERIMPIDPKNKIVSWLGGRPYMPVNLEWPSVDNQPLVFVAQLHCADFPDQLWGGVGPREGWLLFFFGASYVEDGDSAFPVKVLHTTELGEERDSAYDSCTNSDIEWMMSSNKPGWNSGTTLTIPKWPVNIYEKSHDEPERAQRFRQENHRDVERPPPYGLPWPGGLPGNPLTRGGVRIMLACMASQLSDTCVRQMKCIEDFAQIIHAFENPDESNKMDEPDENQTEDADLETLDHIKFEYEVAVRRKPDIEAAIQFNQAELVKLNAYREQNPIEELPEILGDQDWNRILGNLADIKLANITLVSIVEGESAIMGEVYTERRYSIERPETITELKSSISKISSALGLIHKKLRLAATNRTALIKRHSKLPKHQQDSISARFQFQLDRANETLEFAIGLADKVKKERTDLHVLRESISPTDANEMVTDAMWESVSSALSNLVVTDFEWGELVPAVRGRSDFEIKTCSIIEAEYFKDNGAWPGQFETQRRTTAFRLYSENPALLPESVRSHFEPIWNSSAQHEHDGIGGLPRGDGHYAEFFWGPSYYSANDLAVFLHEKPYMTPADAPYDKDNAVLLQLFPNHVTGWLWGDLSHVALIIPRAELARGEFSNILALVEG